MYRWPSEYISASRMKFSAGELCPSGRESFNVWDHPVPRSLPLTKEGAPAI